MIVNEIKTKCMGFGRIKEIEVSFNGKIIEQVSKYKCLGTVIRSVHKINEDPFRENYTHLTDHGRKAIFSMYKRLKPIGKPSPKIMLDLFDSLVKPIFIYGSDVWGYSKTGLSAVDKVFMRFARCVLNVKATTNNLIVYGECG